MRINSIEYDLKPNEKLYFLHIQKTAGTTFYFTLDEKFDPEEICPTRFWRQFLKLAKTDLKQLRSYRLFRGHFGYAVPQFLRKPPVCVTVLRDPIKRSVSHYEHIRREPKDRRHKLVTRENMDLMAFAQHPETRLAILNLQTRSIAFDLGLKQIRKIRNFPAKGVLGTVVDDRTDEDMLAIAKSRINEFPFVGLVERFQDSLFLLSYVFGWYPIRQSRTLNQAPKKTQSDLSPEALDLLYECNRLDLELYDHAKTKFDEQYTLMVKALWTAYGDRSSDPTFAPVDEETLFAWLVQHYEDRNSRRNLTRHQVIDFPFSRAISGHGWHLREGSGSGWHLPGGLEEGGTPFRWTGPETVSTLDFPLETQSDVILKLRIINAAALDILESLSLSVNDSPVELETILQQGNLAVMQAVIPKKNLKSDRNFTRLTFSVDRTTIINPDSSDNRPVGLAFHRLQLFPEHIRLEEQGEDFTYYVFPSDDKNWVDVADTVTAHLQKDDKIAAPGEFFKRFSRQFRSQNLPFANKPQLHWVILHKGKLQVVNRESLYWAVNTMKPVFQNDVFVVLSNRDDVQKQAWRLQDLLILRSQLLLFQLESRNVFPARWRNTLFRTSKILYKRVKRLISDT